MLKVIKYTLYDGVSNTFITGTLERTGEVVNLAILAEGEKPGDLWWEDWDDSSNQHVKKPSFPTDDPEVVAALESME